MNATVATPHSSLIEWLAMIGAGALGPSEQVPAELTQAQSAFRSLVDSLPLNLLIKDAAGRRVFVNRRYLTERNTQPERVLGKTDFDLFPVDLATKFAADDARIMQSGEVLHDVEQHESADGHRRWIERLKGPVLDADGKIVGVQVLFWDVSDRELAEHALDRERYLLHSLMDNVPDSVYFKDRDSRFLRVSRAQARRFGFDNPGDVIGKSDADIFTEEHARQALADERQIMETGQPIIARVQKLTWHDRPDTWVSTTKMPLQDNAGRVVGTFGISRDITELKRMEEDLRSARDAANAASRAKGDFLANMSHEIRTPMNAIIGITELLLDTDITTTQREYLRMVQESGESLLGLLNDILDFSKIEAGRLELDTAPFELRESLGDTLKSLGLRAHKKGLELAFSIDSNVPQVLAGDIGRLRQVVINLIGNAIKFTEAGEVLLDVRCQSQTADEATLRFAVSDTGIGIAPDKQQRVFEAFEQADTSTTRNYGGTGLGLAICSRLVELMGGAIGVQSEPGRGSTFSFTAKFRIVAAPSSDPGRRVVVVADTPVLVVDDNATNRRILFDMLTNWGMKPALASGARQAFQMLQDAARRGQRFKIVLTDVNMPEVDGFEFASWIKDDRSLSGTRIVMLTSAGRPGDADRRMTLGIAGNLLKPVKQSELFDAIVTALGVNAADDERQPQAEAQLQRFDGLRVLLAEDNPVNQKLALGVLGKLGCSVTVAEDGQQAIDVWAGQPFDVVLMDVQMPELDGMAATGAIRKREEFTGRHTPIIAMTAHAMSGDRDRCLVAGMDDYLSKPVRIRELSQKLAEVLHRHEASPVAAEVAAPGPNLIDWAEALEGVGQDRELLQSVLDAFFEESASVLKQVETSVAKKDAVALKKSAHTLKGVLLAVGAHPTSQVAFDLERMGTSGELTGADQALDLLLRQMAAIVPILKAGPPKNL